MSDAPVPDRSTGLSPEAADSLMRVVTGARWFAGKGRRAELRSFTPLPWLNDPPDTAVDPAVEEVPRVRLAVLEVGYPDEVGTRPGDGLEQDQAPGVEHYQLALAHRRDRLPAGVSAAATELYVDDGAVVYDATQDVGGARVLLQALLAGAEVSSEVGGVRFHLRDAGALSPDLEPQVFRGQQSNTSVMFGDVAMLKLFRRLELGRNLDIVVHAALNDAGKSDVARLFGSVEATWTAGGEVLGADLAMCVEKLADAVDGWDLALASLEAETRGSTTTRDRGPGADAGFAVHAAALGRALAEIHEALGSAFGTTDQAGSTVAAVMTQRLGAAAAVAPALLPYAAGLRDRFAALENAHLDAQRVHGDFHLGQTLHTPSGWKIIDFEGEPAKNLAERMAPDSVWRDVAGMMRSFDYAAATVPGEAAAGWRDRCRAAFVDGYTGGRGLGLDDAGLLAAYEADKAVYEVVYEVRNRPDWVGIPLGAVASLASAPPGTDDAPPDPHEPDGSRTTTKDLP